MNQQIKSSSLIIWLLLFSISAVFGASDWHTAANSELASTSLLSESSHSLLNIDSSFQTMSLIDNANSKSSMIDLLSATGGGNNEQSLSCSKTDLSLETKFNEASTPNLAVSGFSLTLLPAGSVASGAISVSLSLDSSAGTFTVGSTTALTLESGSYSNTDMVQFSGSLSDINNALASLSYTPKTNYEGSATIQVYYTGFNIASSSCSIPIAVTVQKVNTIPDPIHCSLKFHHLTSFDYSNLNGGLETDLGSASGYASSRFQHDKFDGPSGDDLTVYFTINPDTSSSSARRLLATGTPSDIYSTLSGLSSSSSQVSGSTYLKYADLSSLSQECQDGSWRSSCSSSSPFSWLLPVIIGSSVVGGLLLIAAIILCVRKYRNAAANKDAATANKDNIAPAIGAAKQYIYTPPTAGVNEFSTSDPSSVNFVSEVAIQEKSKSIDPTRATGAKEDELIAEPVLVGNNEKAAADLAKQRSEQSKEEFSHSNLNSLSNKPKISTSGPSNAGSSMRHFYYIDESKVEGSQSGSLNSQSMSISGQKEESKKSTSSAHFKYSDDNHTVNSKNSIMSTNSNINALPVIPPSTPLSKQNPSFKSTSQLDLTNPDHKLSPSKRSISHSHVDSDNSNATTVNDENSGNTRAISSTSSSVSVQSNKEKKSALKVVRPNSSSPIQGVNREIQ